MFSNKQLLTNIFTKSNMGGTYFIFQHADKTWVLPDNHIRTAFDMYQPSTFKGKVLKTLAILFRNVNFLSGKLGIRKTKLEISPQIMTYVKNLLDTDDIYVAGYMGDTSSNQNNKATLQIYNKKNIWSYIKITADPQIAETFDYEVKGLRYLEDKGVTNIPCVLGQDVVDELHLFAQSTEKKPGRKLFLGFKEKQIYYLKRIMDRTTVELNYHETDFARYINYIKNNLSVFEQAQQSILSKAIEIIEEKYNKPCEYAFSHGDFTPWNVYYTGKAMETFDFEYCNYSMPPYIDAFHYITQLSLLGKNNEVGGTAYLYKKCRKLIEKYVCDPEFTYGCYLVYIISFYKQRTEDNADISYKYSQWIGILEYILGRIEKKEKREGKGK